MMGGFRAFFAALSILALLHAEIGIGQEVVERVKTPLNLEIAIGQDLEVEEAGTSLTAADCTYLQDQNEFLT
jgi:hypothetical protein